LATAVLNLDENLGALSFVHQSVASLVSACQRLLPLGQTEATRILWSLKPAMIACAEASATCSIDAAFCFLPALDLGAMEHPALSTRLFIS
jgi:urease accessory protein